MRQELERSVQEKYFSGMQQQFSRESIYSVPKLMLTETTFMTIVDQRSFQANFERWNGPDLSNSTLTRHMKLIIDMGGT